jgi:alpha-L-fucosidase 2
MAGFGIALSVMPVVSHAAPPVSGLAFGEAAPIYEVSTWDLNIGEPLSLELWLQPAPRCPTGAIIVDRWGPAELRGVQLRMAEGGKLEFVTTSPERCISETPLPVDRLSHVVASFSTRDKVIRLFVDGKIAAQVITPPNRKIDAFSSGSLLRLGADLEGNHRFAGTIAYFALYNRVLSADDVQQLVDGPKALPGQKGAMCSGTSVRHGSGWNRCLSAMAVSAARYTAVSGASGFN